MAKPHVHVLKNEHGRFYIHRLKAPRFTAEVDVEKMNFSNINSPEQIDDSIIKKAKAFVKSELRNGKQ